jgi:hypothetical protein
VQRLAPWLVLVSVTSLLGLYGRASWSWLVGPLTALALWALERKAQTPSQPAPAHRRQQAAPAAVD